MKKITPKKHRKYCAPVKRLVSFGGFSEMAAFLFSGPTITWNRRPPVCSVDSRGKRE